MSAINNQSFSRRGVSRSLIASATEMLRKDKSVFLVPVIGLALNLVFLIGVGITWLLTIPLIENNPSINVQAIITIICAVAFALIHTMTQATVMAMANQRFEGQTPTLSSGFSQTFKHFMNLVIFAFLDAIVGLIMRLLQDKVKGFGSLLSFLAGLAWAVAAYFAIPAIIFEDQTALQAIGRSTSLIKQKWGQALKVNILTSAIVVVGWLICFGALIMSMYSIATNPGIGVTGLVLTVGVFLAFGLFQSTLIAYIKVALYRYATGQSVPGFDEHMTAYAFTTKK